MPAFSALSKIGSRPVLAYYYAQKAIRWAPLRRAMGATIAALIGRPSGVGPKAAEAAAVAAELNDVGISFLPQMNITESQLQDIRTYLRRCQAIDQYDETTAIDVEGGTPPFTDRAFYRINDVLECPTLMNIANDPLVLDAVGRHLGAHPTIALVQIWWTLGEHHVPGRLHYDDVYHRDVDDFRFVKLFAYLTDATAKTGAHSFVKRSHRSETLIRRGPISDDEVHSNFAPQDIMTIEGKAGTVFIEDTWGIHRPLLATEGRRLIFSVLYALTPWVPMNSSHVPSLQLPRGFDPQVNRHFYKMPG